MPRPDDEAARSAAADSACLGSGSTTRHRFTPCVGRLSAAVGTGRARCLWKAVAVCWADALPITASEADRALRPMLPTSAREPWPFCVVRESCHAAMPDQPGLPSIGSGRRTGGSRRRPRLPRLATDCCCMDPAAAWPCCVAVFQSNRKSAAQTALLHVGPKIEPSRAVCVQLCACRQHSEHSGRLRSCRQVWLMR